MGGVGLPTAALYLDDVPMTSSNGQPEIHIYDVERVEALSGPQGTLFGSSSLAGTMRIITRKPKLDKWEAGMDVLAAKYGAGNWSIMPSITYQHLASSGTFNKDFGLYAEATYPILPTVKVTGGIRYFSTSNNTYGFNGTIYDMDTCSFPLTKRLQCINVNEPYHQTGETHKASIAWQVRPDKMLYFTYSTGFRPGGGNNLTGSSPYKADTLDNFEIGVKARFGRNLRVNAAAYYEKWNGVQYQVVVPNTFGSTNTVNAGDARVYGIEADFDWKIGPVLISGSGAYNDSRLSTSFCDLVSSSNLVPRSTCSNETGDLAASKGTRLPRQPRFKGQLTVRYERPIGRWNAFVQGVAFHQSSSTSDLNTANDALFGDPTGFESFDFSTGAKRGGFSAEIFIQNAFDKRGVLSRNAFCEIQTCTEGSRSYPIKPQYFGIRFSQKFL